MTPITLKTTFLPRMRGEYPDFSAYQIEAANGVLLEFPSDAVMRNNLLKKQGYGGWWRTFFVERKEGRVVACFPKGTSESVRKNFLRALAAHKKTKALVA